MCPSVRVWREVLISGVCVERGSNIWCLRVCVRMWREVLISGIYVCVRVCVYVCVEREVLDCLTSVCPCVCAHGLSCHVTVTW